MNIREMHIKFALLRQQNLGNDYQHMNAEMVDDIFNIVIPDFVRAKVNNPQIQEGQSNVLTAQYYEGLENLIRTSKISILQPYPYNNIGKVVDLNSIETIGVDRYVASGDLKAGSQCKVLNYKAGDNFTNINGNNVAGDIFTVQGIASYQPSARSAGYVIKDTDNNYISDSTNLKAGITYSIMNGTITFSSVDLTVYGVTVDGKTYINGENHVGDLIIDKDSSFIINDVLTPTTWTNGTVIEILNIGDTFYKFISSSSVVNYGANGITVEVISPNRIFKSKDVNLYLAHGRGTVISSPISHREGGSLIVYENKNNPIIPINEQFSIDSVLIKYYKRPNIVSLAQSIDCDLNEIDHPEIIRMAVELSSAADSAKNFETIRANNIENKSI